MASRAVKVSERRRPLELECLEERIAPAGAIWAGFSGSGLTITGDDEANEFSLGVGAAPTLIRVTPLNGTLLNGGTDPRDFGPVSGDIILDLGGGDDTVSLFNMLLAKNLQLDGGAGTDHVSLDALNLAGGSIALADAEYVDFIEVVVGRDVRVTYSGDGYHCVHAFLTNVGGNFSVTQRGQDMLSEVGISTATIGGTLAVSSTTGTHAVGDSGLLSVVNSSVGAVNVKMGGGDYSFGFIGSEVARGNISLSYGVGDVDALIDSSTVSGSVSFRTGGGLAAMAYDDVFRLSNDSVIQGKLTVRTFDSDDVVFLDDVYVMKGVAINTGTGSSSVTINHCGLGVELVGGRMRYSACTISQTASGYFLPGDATTVSISQADIGSLTLQLRSQDAVVAFDRVGVYGNLKVSAQGGDDILGFSDVAVLKNFSLRAGGGDDVIAFNQFDGRAGLSIDAGDGVDSVLMDTLNGGAVGSYAGPVRVLLGDGDDYLQLGSPDLGGDSGQYLSRVLLNGGAGRDEVFLASVANTFAVEPRVLIEDVTSVLVI